MKGGLATGKGISRRTGRGGMSRGVRAYFQCKGCAHQIWDWLTTATQQIQQRGTAQCKRRRLRHSRAWGYVIVGQHKVVDTPGFITTTSHIVAQRPNEGSAGRRMRNRDRGNAAGLVTKLSILSQTWIREINDLRAHKRPWTREQPTGCKVVRNRCRKTRHGHAVQSQRKRLWVIHRIPNYIVKRKRECRMRRQASDRELDTRTPNSWIAQVIGSEAKIVAAQIRRRLYGQRAGRCRPTGGNSRSRLKILGVNGDGR